METGRADRISEVTGVVNGSQEEAQVFSLTTKGNAVV